MAIITKIEIFEWKGKKKIAIYYGNIKCTFFDEYRLGEIESQLGKKIKIGAEIDCEEIKKVEAFLWKNKYKDSRGREKERIELVKQQLKKAIPELQFEDIGFGVKSEDIIYHHPDQKGGPDLKVIHPKKNFYLEVTGKQGCGETLRIRPDKIDYYKTNNLSDSFFAHTCDREKEIFFIKIDLNREYHASNINIAGTLEQMVVFKRGEKGVYKLEEFIEGLKKHLDSI